MRLVEFVIASVGIALGYTGAAVLDRLLPIVIDVRVSPSTGHIAWYVALVVCVGVFYGVLGYIARGVPRPIVLPRDDALPTNWKEIANDNLGPVHDTMPSLGTPSLPSPPEWNDKSDIHEIGTNSERIAKLIEQTLRKRA